MVEISYKVNELFTQSVDKLNDFVVRVNFDVIGTLNGESKVLHQTADFEIVKSDTDFIPYNKLTEIIVIDWIKKTSSNRLKSLEIFLTNYFKAQENPITPPIKKTLPF
jgi:hypothetical protein